MVTFWLYPKNETANSGRSFAIRKVGDFGVPSAFITSHWWSRSMAAESTSPARSKNSRLITSRTGRMWTVGTFAGPRQYWSNRVKTMAWFADHAVRVNGPLPQSAPRARLELGAPHRTPPLLLRHDSERIEPTVEARIGKKAGYGRRRWNTTESLPVRRRSRIRDGPSGGWIASMRRNENATSRTASWLLSWNVTF